MLIKNDKVNEVYGITDREKQRIMDYLQGAVYCWCKNRPNEWFSVRDFLGGDNYDWHETPLIVLYEKHILKGKDETNAINAAGKDAGWLLKKVIAEDQRHFDTKKEDLIRKYKWV